MSEQNNNVPDIKQRLSPVFKYLSENNPASYDREHWDQMVENAQKGAAEEKYALALNLYAYTTTASLETGEPVFVELPENIMQQTLTQVFDLFRECAEEGHKAALLMTVSAYLNGTGNDRDIQAAEKWLNKAADIIGDHPAINAYRKQIRREKWLEKGKVLLQHFGL